MGDDINFSYGYYSSQWDVHFMDGGELDFQQGCWVVKDEYPCARDGTFITAFHKTGLVNCFSIEFRIAYSVCCSFFWNRAIKHDYLLKFFIII